MTILDGDYSQTIRVNERRFRQPFSGRGDESVYLCEEDVQQLASAYAPLDLDTPHPDEEMAGYYLVADGLNPTEVGGRVRQWTRLWAKIPARRIEGSSFSWVVPGLSRGGTNPVVNISSVSAASGGLVEITTDGAHGLNAGDKVYFYYEQTQNQYKPQGIYPTEVISTDGALDRFSVRATGIGAFYENACAVQKAGQGRDPRTKAVNCDVVYDYFLPGQTPGVATKDQIPLLTPPEVYDEFGQLVDPPSYTALTTPTNSAYLAQVAAKEKIVAQESTISRWYGNIYERITRKVTAQ